MTVLLVLLFVVLLAGLAGVVFLLGFKVGGDTIQERLFAVRLESARAERDLHNLTRRAFIAMAEEAQRKDSR